MAVKNVKSSDTSPEDKKEAPAKDDTNYFTSPHGHIRDRILIHPNPAIPKEGIFMSLNGFGFLVKPGVEVDLPRPVVEMLETRIQTETTQDEEGNNFTRDIPRFTFTVIKKGSVVPEAAVAAKSLSEQEMVTKQMSPEEFTKG